MTTAVIKRSILINGKKTSVSLENEFWSGLQDIAKANNTTTAKLAGEIAQQRTTVNLSSAIRIYVFNYFRKQKMKLEGARGQRHLDSRTLRIQVEECRALAASLKSEEARTAMLKIADDYEWMAANTERLKRAAEPD